MCNDHCPNCDLGDIEPYESEDIGEEGDDLCDLCDLCMSSGVNVARTTYCGKTIGIECGCDESNEDGTCGNPACEECQKGKEED
jgi:hypothetical protein